MGSVMFLFNSLYLELVSYVMFLCFFIPLWVFLILGWQVYGAQGTSSLSNESKFIEFWWTVGPTLSVIVLCVLNLQCLASDSVTKMHNMIKVVGRQWYWSYEVAGEEGLYDSLMLDFMDTVDKPLRFYLNDSHQLIVTSSDVIHSFALPAFNIKMDAIPGRMNQVVFCPDRLGVFVGYCSELCGAGHAYMPIVAEVIKKRG